MVFHVLEHCNVVNPILNSSLFSGSQWDILQLRGNMGKPGILMYYPVMSIFNMRLFSELEVCETVKEGIQVKYFYIKVEALHVNF